MDVTITPRLLSGCITPPPSKSQAHRVIIAAALSDGFCRISNLERSEDIKATLRCMRTLDADASADGSIIRGADLVDGHEEPAPTTMDCGESGSTLRFLIPVALALKGKGCFAGHGRLMERPQEPYFELFKEKGISYEQTENILTVEGKLTPGQYSIRGDISSQFITGLLYALPLLPGDSEIHLTTDLESRGYVYMTLNVLKLFGVKVRYDGARTFHVPGNQIFAHRDITIEADWSNAAFWFAAAAAGNEIEVMGMDEHSIQGDRLFAGLLWHFEGPPSYRSISVSHTPDLVPPLAALAALREGTTELKDAGRLRIKESDRLSAVTQVLGAMGAEVKEYPDRLVIYGQKILAGGVAVDSYNDHRIAMMAAIAATRCTAPVTITGAECVKKSYPGFWEDYEALGGQITRN